jgi:hypothetical protein
VSINANISADSGVGIIAIRSFFREADTARIDGDHGEVLRQWQREISPCGPILRPASQRGAVADFGSRRSMRASLKLSEPRNTSGTHRQSRSAGEERRARTQSHSLSLGLLIQLYSSRVPRLIIASFRVECISDRKETTIIVASCELDPILHYFPIIYDSCRLPP